MATSINFRKLWLWNVKEHRLKCEGTREKKSNCKAFQSVEISVVIYKAGK